MARTCTTAQRNLIAGQTVNHYIKVLVANPDGVMTDVSAYLGVDWLDTATWGEELDTPVSSATLTLRRDTNAYSLSPLMSGSLANRNGVGAYAPFIEKGRPIQIYTAVTAANTAPISGDWKLMFYGRIDSISWADNPITIQCSDLGAWIADAWIRDSIHTYAPIAAPGSGVLLGTAIQNMLNGWPIFDSPITLYQPVTAAWQPNGPAPQPAASILDAARSMAQAIGWELRYRFDASDNYRFTLYQPPRTNSTPDWIIGPTEYRSVKTLEAKIDNIRNIIYGQFSDGTNFYGEGGTFPARVASDSSSIAKYGERFMGIKSNVIQTTTDMDALLAAVLSDLSESDVDHTIELPYFWPVQLGDVIQLNPNLDHYDSAQTLGAVAYQHTFQNGEGSTSISVRGKPAGAYKSWLAYSATQGSAAPNGPPTCWITADTAGATDTSIDITFNGAVGKGASLLEWQYSVNHGSYTAASTTALPQVFTVTRQPKAEVVIVLKVTQEDGQTTSASYVVQGKMVAMDRTGGDIDRSIPWNDGFYGLSASNNTGTAATSTVTDSRSSALNTHFRYSTDISDGVVDGTGSPITGGKRGFVSLNSSNRLVTAVDEIASIGQESALALSKRAGIFFSETFTSLPGSQYNKIGTGTSTLITDTSNTSVGKFLLQNSSGEVWLVFAQGLAFNPTKLYRLRSRVRCTADSDSLIYFGWQGYLSDGVTTANTNGGYQYIHHAGTHLTVADGWIVTTTWVKGATLDGSAGFGGGPSIDPTAPSAVNTNTAIVYPVIATNYPSPTGGGTFQVDYFQIDELDEDSSLRTYTVLDAGTSLGRLRSGAADSRGAAVNGMFRYSVDQAPGVVETATKVFYNPSSDTQVADTHGFTSTLTAIKFIADGDYWRNQGGTGLTLGGTKYTNDSGTLKGYVYWDSAGFGLVSSGTLWTLQIPAGTSNVNVANGSLLIGGNPFAINSGTNYNILYEPGGNQAVHLGNSGDPSNYYNNTAHIFRNRGGGTVYATITSNGVLVMGTTSPVSTSLLSAVQNGNSIEFGHANAAGFRGTLGAEASSGKNFLAFHAEAGTTANTYRTRGQLGSIFRGDAAGGFGWYNVANSNADNQSLVQLLTLSSGGILGLNTGAYITFSGYSALGGGSSYTYLYGPDGRIGVYVGPASGDYANYYDAPTHFFRSETGTQRLMINSSGTFLKDTGGTSYQVATVVSGSSAPTSSTPGVAGTIYIVT